jgi:hypothetical protein
VVTQDRRIGPRVWEPRIDSIINNYNSFLTACKSCLIQLTQYVKVSHILLTSGFKFYRTTNILIITLAPRSNFGSSRWRWSRTRRCQTSSRRTWTSWSTASSYRCLFVESPVSTENF